MWWSYSDGSTWSGHFQLADRRSDYGPSLATDDLGHVVMAWRGAGTDNHIWWSRLTSGSWSPGRASPTAAPTAPRPRLHPLTTPQRRRDRPPPLTPPLCAFREMDPSDR